MLFRSTIKLSSACTESDERGFGCTSEGCSFLTRSSKVGQGRGRGAGRGREREVRERNKWECLELVSERRVSQKAELRTGQTLRKPGHPAPPFSKPSLGILPPSPPRQGPLTTPPPAALPKQTRHCGDEHPRHTAVVHQQVTYFSTDHNSVSLDVLQPHSTTRVHCHTCALRVDLTK